MINKLNFAKPPEQKNEQKPFPKPYENADYSNCGRNSGYKPEYDQIMLDYFSISPTEQRPEEVVTAKGDVVVKMVEKSSQFPTFERFSVQLGYSTKTLLEWCKEFESFRVVYEKCKQLQKHFLIENGLQGRTNASFTMFVAKNITDMRDQVEVKHSGNIQLQPVSYSALKQIQDSKANVIEVETADDQPQLTQSHDVDSRQELGD